MKHLSILLTVLLALQVACTPDQGELIPEQNAIGERKSNFSPASANSAFTTFKVRIENITSGNTFVSPFSPGIYLVQKQNSAPIFVVGQPDFGEGLEDIAEDGSPGVLNQNLVNNPKVRSHGIFNTPAGANGPAPIFPGGAYEFYVTAKDKDYLNFATMFIQSNDIFIGPDAQGIPLFDGNKNPISGDVTAYVELWDAGTEVNEEPGVGPNQAPRQSGPDTGIDENGNVRLVDDVYTYPAVSDIVKVTVTPQ